MRKSIIKQFGELSLFVGPDDMLVIHLDGMFWQFGTIEYRREFNSCIGYGSKDTQYSVTTLVDNPELLTQAHRLFQKIVIAADKMSLKNAFDKVRNDA